MLFVGEQNKSISTPPCALQCVLAMDTTMGNLLIPTYPSQITPFPNLTLHSPLISIIWILKFFEILNTNEFTFFDRSHSFRGMIMFLRCSLSTYKIIKDTTTLSLLSALFFWGLVICVEKVYAMQYILVILMKYQLLVEPIQNHKTLPLWLRGVCVRECVYSLVFNTVGSHSKLQLERVPLSSK